jgi:hypothetical protein
MPWISGTFSRTNGEFSGASVWAQDASVPYDISPARFDTHDQDLADGINACLLRTGENPMLGDLNLGGNDIVGAATLRLTSAINVALDSTGHGLQIGSSGAANLALGDGQIQSRNDGAAAALDINALGGAVNIGGNTTVTGSGTFIGAALTLDNSAAATAADIKVRNSEGGFALRTDGDVLSLLQTDASGSVEDTWATFTADGASTLYHNNVAALRTAAQADGHAEVYDGAAWQAVGFRHIPQNAQTGNYTLVLADAGKHIHHASGAGSGDTYTIPANSSVAFPIGTAITFTNLDSNAVAIAITTDTLRLAGAGTTGTRSLAQYGVATAIKIETTVWVISGTGLT